MKTCKDLPKPLQHYQQLMFETSKIHGLNTISACIISFLSIQTEEKTMEEIARHTKYSLASLSTTIKQLIEHKLVIKTKKPGSKKLYFTTQLKTTDLVRESIHTLKAEQELHTQIQPIIKELKQVIREEKNTEKKQELKKKLTIIEEHEKENEFMKHIIIVLEKELNKWKAKE